MSIRRGAADIRRYLFRPEDRLFLDANIWLLIYGPLAARRKRSAVYSMALADIRKAGSRLHLDVLVLSEFINAFARIECNQSLPKPVDFKIFRKSAAFKPIAADIAQNAKRIARQCQHCESGLSTVNVEALLTEFGIGESDFNDQMIAHICLSNGLTLVTDDGDFRGSGLNILTANGRLLPSP